ncbi:MAG: hypothetical protein DRP64_04560 [Verrucomicrobia bacterium]|nr:MAG: hypothetical protein DRP64_04560 [Verrucomicrobiota bacterium]
MKKIGIFSEMTFPDTRSCRPRDSFLTLFLLVAGLIPLSYEVGFAHAGAHPVCQDLVVAGNTAKSMGAESLAGSSGHLDLTVFDEQTNEVPFMVSLTRTLDGLDFEPPNALKLGALFEGNGRTEDRREIRLPRTLGGYTWCVPKGFSAELPVGEWEIVVRRGIEHFPVREMVHISEGKTTRKSIYTLRWENMAARGWFSGDDHVHCRTIDDADTDMVMTWAKAEDVYVVNALRMDDLKQSYFTPRGFGKENRVIDGNFAIVPGQEGPRTYDMGHVIGLNITDHVWNSDTYHCYEYTLDEFRKQGGVAGYAHAHAAAFNVHRDMSMNIPKGKVDFLEIFEGGWLGTKYYYPWLNLGFKITASAGSDVPWYGTIGSVRVYAYTGSDRLDVDQWFNALKNGHTFVSNGPMVDFKIDDAIPGDTLSVQEGQSMHVYARAWADPVDFRPYRLEIIQNGEIIHSVEQTNSAQTELVMDFNLTVDKGSWVAAHVADAPGSTFAKRAEAHTTPIYLECGGLRFWKYNEVKKLISDQVVSLNEIEEMIQLAHRSREEDKNLLNTKYQEWELDYRIERIIATEDLLREKIWRAQKIYAELLEIYKQEKMRRSDL